MTIKGYLKRELRQLYLRAIYAKYEKPATGIPASDINTADIDGVSIFPDMDSLTPVQTIEYDVALNGWCTLLERSNASGIDGSEAKETIVFRIIVTGTDMTDTQVLDVIMLLPGRAGTDTTCIVNPKTPDTSSSAKYGVYFCRTAHPKTLGSGYGWLFDFNTWTNNTHHLKVQVYKTSSAVTFKTAQTSSLYNSTYHTSPGNYATNKIRLLFTPEMSIIGSATYSEAIKNYLPTLAGTDNAMKAGEALASDTLAFKSTDGKLYKISTTNKPILPEESVMSIGGSFSADSAVAGLSARSIKANNSFSLSSATYGTFAQFDEVYLRCSLTNGQIYSDGVLTNTVSAGYTWINLGTASSATLFGFNSTGKQFFTLDAEGKLTHINGREIAGGSAGGGVTDVTVGGTSVVSGGVAVIPAIPTVEALTSNEIDTLWTNN